MSLDVRESTVTDTVQREAAKPAEPADAPQVREVGVDQHPPFSLTALLRRPDTWLTVLPLLAAGVWVLGFVGADPRSMGSIGLLTLFTWATVLALTLLVGGFLLSLKRDRPEWVLAGYVITYIGLVHGTPAVLYGTLRYSWAYKHVGIVDYIMRTGTVDPTISVGAIYHNWPGFFAGSALLTEAAGQLNAIQLATWAPVAFNIMNLLVLRYLFRGLTRNKRLIWLGLFFFFIINWVGQDYFSPQAVAYVLYLAVLGLLIRRSPKKIMIIPFVLIVAVVAATHQITPMMLMLAVGAMVVLRRTSGWYLPIVAGGIIAAWAFSAAQSYTVPNIMDLVVGLGKPVENAGETLDKATLVTSSQLLVVWGGRSTVIVSTLVALVGAWRSWRGRGLGITAVLLMVLPGVLVLVTGFGGEVLFRAFLFAAPFIAFLAAAACLPRDGRGFGTRNVVISAVVAALVLPGFFLSYYGKERSNYFTADEVQAAAWVDTHGRPGSLLVEGSRNYPTQFLNYENFTYVPIDREDAESYPSMVADPAGKFGRWLADERYTDAYFLITRSQKMATEDARELPPGALDRIEQALRSSPEFKVAYENRDAVVFELANPDGPR